jgi:hypothetical protein
MWLVIPKLIAAVALLEFVVHSQSVREPQVRIAAPVEFSAVKARLESADSNLLADVAELVGLENPGPVIQVVLANESSPLAERTAPWIAGFALGSSGEVVIFPARSPSYPHYSLEDVLRHEVAHVLIARAAGGEPVPRWFNEGLAMAAERSWGLADQTRVLYQLVLGRAASFSEIDSLFAADNKNDLDRAYALSGAIVRRLIQQFGGTVASAMLARMRSNDVPFERAFADVSGMTISQAESEFWDAQRVWTTWVPILTSSTAVWMLVTVIAIVAILKRRRKDAEMKNRWDKEDAEL